MNRTQFVNLLATEWLPAMPDVDERLRSGSARVADVACGTGWSSVAMAKAYPDARVDGFDLDPASIELAREVARSEGVTDRVDFQVRDAADPELADRYDLVTVFEAVHDMAKPVEALRAIRGCSRRAASRWSRTRVADEFTAPGDDVERVMYGWSILTASLSGGSSSRRPRPGRRCARRPFGATRRRPGSGRSRSCRSSTTSGASTAWRLRRRDRGREREAPSPQPTRAPVPFGSSSRARSESRESSSISSIAASDDDPACRRAAAQRRGIERVPKRRFVDLDRPTDRRHGRRSKAVRRQLRTARRRRRGRGPRARRSCAHCGSRCLRSARGRRRRRRR